jgi:serine/threonine protein phosphatase Stp1
MNPVPWRSAARTQRGKLRARNEDAFLDRPQSGCWAVADGMGGHRAGDVASQAVIANLHAGPAGRGAARVLATARSAPGP